MKNNQITKRLSRLCVVVILLAVMVIPASAAGLNDSDIYTGTMNLLADLMLAATIACPTVGGLAAVVFLLRRSMADAQDGKMWMNRVVIAVACGVGGGLVTGLISLIASYYAGA